jgi:hypothetical protein
MEPSRHFESQSEEIRQQLERITGSPVLHGAESLCKLLGFLVDYTLTHPGEGMKEYMVATNVFGRNPEFDPRIDPIVRVQVGRLRSKLIEYYATDGAHDAVQIEIPKGGYTPAFHQRLAEGAEESWPAGAERAGEELPQEPASQAVAPPRALWKALAWTVVGVALGAGSVTAWRAAQGSGALPAVVRSFWRPYLDAGSAPLVVFSNAAFVGDSVNGLRYFDPGRDSASEILDHYTGTGEVLAIHALDRLFLGLGVPLTVKRGRLMTWDDARNRSLIFIGAPSENLPLRELPWQEDFSFPGLSAKNDERRRTITNLHPLNGEPVAFVGVPNSIDYAVISKVEATGESRAVLVMAGMTTVGTQAATEFVCGREGVEKLAAKVPSPAVGRFSALLQVIVKGGVPFETRLVTVHAHPH